MKFCLLGFDGLFVSDLAFEENGEDGMGPGALCIHEGGCHFSHFFSLQEQGNSVTVGGYILLYKSFDKNSFFRVFTNLVDTLVCRKLNLRLLTRSKICSL